MTTTGAVPAIAIRTCAAIIESDEICLIRRARPDGDQYSLPGGLLHPEEEVPVALARELKEELDLDVTALPDRPRLRWAQDEITTRPGRTGTFRRLHLIHLLAIPRYVRAVLPATEQDAEDITSVVWVPLAQAAERHLCPAVGNALSQLTEPADAPSNVLLPRSPTRRTPGADPTAQGAYSSASKVAQHSAGSPVNQTGDPAHHRTSTATPCPYVERHYTTTSDQAQIAHGQNAVEPSRCCVARAEQILRSLHVPRRAELNLQIARPVVAEPGHVSGEPGKEVDVPRVGLQVDQELAPLGRADTGEVSQLLECRVLLALDAFDAASEPEQRLLGRAHHLHHRRALDVDCRPRLTLSAHPTSYLYAAADGRHGLKPEQVAAEESVADQVDRPPVLAYGVYVVACEVAGDTDQTRSAPQHLGCGRSPEPVTNQVLELGPVIHQPREIEQALVDDAFSEPRVARIRADARPTCPVTLR